MKKVKGGNHHNFARKVRIDPIPQNGDKRWGLSLVATPNDDVRHAVSPLLADLTAQLSPNHYVYTPEKLHTTVFSVTGFIQPLPQDTVSHYLNMVHQHCHQAAPFTIRLTSLALAPSGVLLGGIPLSDSIFALRRSIRDQIVEDGAQQIPSPDMTRLRDTAHMSLAVYTSPKVPKDLLAVADKHRSWSVVDWQVSKLSLVDYSFNDGHVGMHTHDDAIMLRGE